MEELQNSYLGVFFIIMGLGTSIALLIKVIEFMIDLIRGEGGKYYES